MNSHNTKRQLNFLSKNYYLKRYRTTTEQEENEAFFRSLLFINRHSQTRLFIKLTKSLKLKLQSSFEHLFTVTAILMNFLSSFKTTSKRNGFEKLTAKRKS